MTSRAEREKCWASRDAHIKCLNDTDWDEPKCMKTQAAFQKDCSKSWYEYFIREARMKRFKEKQKDDLFFFEKDKKPA